MPWFRLYNETVSDPKIQTLDLCSKWMWVTCLCIASASDERGMLLIGTLPATSKELSSIAGISEKAGQTAIEKLIGRGMLVKDQNTLKVKNWDTRQFESDGGSKDRVRRYRERMKKNAGDCNGYMKYRDTVIERDGGACVYCGSTENLCIDHIVPIVLGGDHEPDNLATACKACNSGKSGRLPEQAGYAFKNPAVERMYQKAKTRLLQQNVTVTVTSQNTDNRIQITDKEEPIYVGHSPEDRVPYERLRSLWNEIVAPKGTPQVESLSASRKQHIRARWKSRPDKLKEIEDWESFFRWIASECSNVCTKGWFSFDFLFKSETNLLKTLEGNYQNNRQAR